MKALPAGLAAKLASGVTTLCHCWRVGRADGVVLAFTDHDRDLAFGGDVYRAGSGMSASAWAARAGLTVDTIDAHGALSDAALTEADLARGLWDGASVGVYRVDWSAVADRVQIFAGTIGEVERGPLAFRAELRSLSHFLNQPKGRLYGLCDAEVGDGRCKVDLESAAFKGSGIVASVAAARTIFRTAGLGAFPADWFRRGKLSWTGGGNDGAAMEVKRHTLAAGLAVIELVAEMPFAIVAGDAFTLRAGCDQSAGMCAKKFNNILNHRGFPHMPGNDWVVRYPNRDDGNDGGAFGGGLL